jgi:hypothetical protein
MSIAGTDHVQLAMPEGKEAGVRTFYTGIFGIAEVAKPENLAKRGGVRFESGDVTVHLGVEQDFRRARKAHPAFRVGNHSVSSNACQVQALKQSTISCL